MVHQAAPHRLYRDLIAGSVESVEGALSMCWSTWLESRRAAGFRRHRSSYCGRRRSCRTRVRSIWGWRWSSFWSHSGPPARRTRGAWAGNETSSPGGPPRTSGQTGGEREKAMRAKGGEMERGNRWAHRWRPGWDPTLRNWNFIPNEQSVRLRGGIQECILVSSFSKLNPP